MSLVLTILLVSTAFQLTATGLAIYLIRVTGWRSPWIMIAAANALMSVRRLITLSGVGHWDERPPDLAAEGTALVISVLMVGGIALVGRMFLEARRAREELGRREEQHQQARKLESIGRLASGVAHDFNNLLTVIISHANLLKREVPAEGPAQERVTQVLDAGQRAAALTHQLLAFARRQITLPRPIDLGELVRRTEPMLRRLIREDVAIVTRHADGLGAVVADPVQMEQVLINLAVNARDAMPNGGTLTIETANVELDEAETRRYAEVRPGRYVMLTVSDTGVGMDEQVRSRLFEPFFTTKELGRGTGLGLATCYGIVKQSGGHIWVYSEPGHGTTFKVFLPCVAARAESEAPHPARPAPPRGSETILLAEDEPSVRTIMTETLRELGYSVLVAGDGDEALRCAKSLGRPIDLLISDALMPHLSGCDLARGVRAIYPNCKVLFVSGYTEEASLQNQVRDEGVEFLPKPFPPHVLANRVREVLERA